MDLVSTSYIERLNATTRLHMRRLTRLTLAFSKKLDNFEAAVALHFAYYNLVKRHGTLRCTPAMAAGVERDFWSVGDLVEATARQVRLRNSLKLRTSSGFKLNPKNATFRFW
jgi:hypothetical protein